MLKTTFGEWSADKAPRLGAALSYYTVFSLAPVLIVAIAVAGLFFGKHAAEGKIVEQLHGMLGLDAAGVVQTMVVKASGQRSGIVATVVGLLTLVLGATAVMIELQDALNTVWKVMPKPGRGLKGLIRDRLLSLSLVVTLGFLLLVSLVASALLAALGGWLSTFIPGWVILGYVLNYGVSLGLITLLIALIFKVLPDARVSWRDAWIGAVATSVLFHVGKYLIGFYIGKAGVASPFGAAGSLAVLLVWVYYSAQIVLLGAEFTRAYANQFGSGVAPDANAVEAPHAAPERLAEERRLKEVEQLS